MAQAVEGALQWQQPQVAVIAGAWAPLVAAATGWVTYGRGSIPSCMCMYLDFHLLCVYVCDHRGRISDEWPG